MAATVFIFGSSIPYGLMDMEASGWGARLRLLVDAAYPPMAVPDDTYVYNLGIPGDTTAKLARRFVHETAARVRDHAANIFIFSVGGNDAAYTEGQGGYAVPVEAFTGNYRQLIEAAQDVGGSIILTSLTPIIDEIAAGRARQKSNAHQVGYNQAIRSLAAEYGLPLVDFEAAFAGRDLRQLINDEGVHPNAAGHALMIEVVAPIVLSQLERD